MMPSSDEHPGRDVIGEHSLGTRRRVGKTEFVADVAGTQRGVVDDRAEGDAVLQVGKEHCAGEVAGDSQATVVSYPSVTRTACAGFEMSATSTTPWNTPTVV